MKNILLLPALLFFTSYVFAQSSISDIPAAKTVMPAKLEPAVSSINPVSNSVTEKKAVKDNNGSVAPEIQKAAEIKSTPQNSVNSTNTGLQIPATEKQSNISNTNCSAIAIKPIEAQSLQVDDKSIPVTSGSIITKPLIQMTVSATNTGLLKNTVPATNEINTNKLPAVQIDNSKKVITEEVPPSIINPAFKVPEVPMQGAEKPKGKG